MNTHTPGPWRVIQNWHGKIAVVNGKTRVANAPHMDITKMEKKLGREAALEATTGMANARLIAAAPDMLSALKLAADIIGADDRVDPILDAIAKAEDRNQ